MIAPGAQLGNYVVQKQIGEGGMGCVYLAEHPVIGRRVAIKVIHPEFARNPEAISRFFTEARSVNRIRHPNIVDITDFGESADGSRYFVMEFLEGESLAGRLRHGKPTQAEVLRIAMQIADAIGAAHKEGILHRDLKPDNVFLVSRGDERDFVKVLDFGLAKLVGSEEEISHKTRSGAVMGTPYYMSPEQCVGRSDIDGRTDVYALGVIMFQMLTGRVPFDGRSYGDVIIKHATEPAPLVRSSEPGCPVWLDKLVWRCMAKEREQRPASMSDLKEALRLNLGGPAGQASAAHSAQQPAAPGPPTPRPFTPPAPSPPPQSFTPPVQTPRPFTPPPYPQAPHPSPPPYGAPPFGAAPQQPYRPPPYGAPQAYGPPRPPVSTMGLAAGEMRGGAHSGWSATRIALVVGGAVALVAIAGIGIYFAVRPAKAPAAEMMGLMRNLGDIAYENRYDCDTMARELHRFFDEHGDRWRELARKSEGGIDDWSPELKRDLETSTTRLSEGITACSGNDEVTRALARMSP